MSKTAIVTFTDGGLELYKRLRINGDLYFNKKLTGGVKKYMPKIMRDYDAVIFISACGIAVRMIKEYVVSKDVDPAVIVMDECGKFVIPILSGHLGGANELATKIANRIGATAVVTTASDSHGVESIDMFAKKHSLVIEDIKSIAPVMARIVEKRKVIIKNDTAFKYEYSFATEDEEKAEAALVISSAVYDFSVPTTSLRPRELVVGIGAKRETPKETVMKAIENAFEMKKLSPLSIVKMVSIDLKKDEVGIIEAAKELGVPFETYSDKVLNEVEGEFEESEFVKKTTGCGAVSARAAALFGDLLLEKYVYNGVTISIGKVR